MKTAGQSGGSVVLAPRTLARLSGTVCGAAEASLRSSVGTSRPAPGLRCRRLLNHRGGEETDCAFKTCSSQVKRPWKRSQNANRGREGARVRPETRRCRAGRAWGSPGVAGSPGRCQSRRRARRQGAQPAVHEFRKSKATEVCKVEGRTR